MFIIQNCILLLQIDVIFPHLDLEVTSAETKDFNGPTYILHQKSGGIKVYVNIFPQQPAYIKNPLNQFVQISC